MIELFGRPFDASYACSDGVRQYLYRNVEPSSVEEALASPLARDYTPVQDVSGAENRAVTLQKGARTLHFFYQKSNRTLTVTTDALADVLY